MDWQDQLRALRDADPSLRLSDSDQQPQPEESATVTDSPQPRVDISLERKGRGGKTATLITGWVLDYEAVKQIAARLKQQLGAGGSARGGDILIQGDRRSDVNRLLTEMGYKSRII